MASSTPEAVVTTDRKTVDVRRELIARVIASIVFAKCERLCSFLSVICELTLTGRASEINEHALGTSVFGRPDRYDSTADGIVRTQASRLRQKLDLYFNGEGSGEPIRIVLPRGSYVPVFEERLLTTEPPAPTGLIEELPAGDADKQGERRKFLIYLWTGFIALAVLLVISSLIYKGIVTISWKGRSPSHPLWTQLFSSDRPTLVVPGDSGLVMWQGIMNQNISLGEYLSEGHGMNENSASSSLQQKAADFGHRRYTSIVDLEVVESIEQLAARQKGRIEIRYARDLRLEDLRRENVILIGATEANPWVELYERNMNFVFSEDRSNRVMSVINMSKRPNEPSRWDSGSTDKERRVYAVVAFLQNLSGNGNTLIVEGTSMAGTDSAWDFVSDETQLLPFLNQIRRPGGSVPHFEIVLGTNNFNGSAAKSSVLAWRTYP